MTATVTPARMRVFGELERATRPRRTAGKINKYLGRTARLIDKGEVDLAAIVICHHDPRRDISGRARREGDGAEHLAESLRNELASGRYSHFTALQEYLRGAGASLDIGRLIVVQDWDKVRKAGIGASGYSLAPYPDGSGGETFGVGLYTVALEFERLEKRVRAYVLGRKGGTP